MIQEELKDGRVNPIGVPEYVVERSGRRRTVVYALVRTSTKQFRGQKAGRTRSLSLITNKDDKGYEVADLKTDTKFIFAILLRMDKCMLLQRYEELGLVAAPNPSLL